MLKIEIDETELFDPKTLEFHYLHKQEIKLEHSLISVSKWESKWNVPFLSDKDKTNEQTLDYIKCMTLTPNVDPLVYFYIKSNSEILKKIKDYIRSPMTATTITNKRPNNQSREIITSELIYYWMIAYGIPFECEKWHLKRLLTLITICSIKNDTKAPKMGKNEILSQNRALNEARRKKLHSKG